MTVNLFSPYKPHLSDVYIAFLYQIGFPYLWTDINIKSTGTSVDRKLMPIRGFYLENNTLLMKLRRLEWKVPVEGIASG